MAMGVSAQTPTPTQLDAARVKNNSTQGGASQTAQLLDWLVIRPAAQLLRTGAVCLPSTPCNVNIGGTVSQFTGGPYTFILTNSRSGSVCLYINNLGGAIAGYGGGLAAGDITASAGFTAVPNINACPQDGLVLAKWHVTAGAFDAPDPTQQLASYLGYKPSPINGTGIIVTPGARDAIAIDTGTVMRKYSCPGGPATTLPAGGTQGDYCLDYTGTRAIAYVCANPSGCTTASDWKGF
ncbi:MAG: hypothetical protein M3Z32_08305 [Acidobacteriota bacterium]|nr:hypothetical protein [Acidobacteriota bacterium]